MGIDALAFGLGAILLLIGILGGGFELKELKIPTVSKPVRFISLVAGVFLLLLGIGIHFPDPQPAPLIAEQGLAPTITAAVDPEAELVAAIRYADEVEIQARRDLDPAPLSRAYTGEALRAEIDGVRSLTSQKLYADASLDDQSVQFVKVAADGKSAEVRLVETWSAVYYSLVDGKCVSRSPQHEAAQTIHLQRTDSGWMVSAVLYDLRAPKGKAMTCE